jgi:hypothetical protein
MADWLTFVQRDRAPDYHPEQEVHNQMHRFFAGVLQFLGMFVEPNRQVKCRRPDSSLCRYLARVVNHT